MSAKEIWDCYYIDQAEAMADTWHPKRILRLLGDKETHLQVNQRLSVDQTYIDVNLRGDCHDGRGMARCRLHRDQMTDEDIEQLLDIVAERFPPGRQDHLQVRKRVADSMGRPRRDHPGDIKPQAPTRRLKAK